MKSMRAVAIGIITIGALVCATLIAAQQKTAAPRNPLMRVQAVETSSDSLQMGINVVKTIVTAEVVQSSLHGRFVDWDELYRSPDAQKFWQQLHISAGPQVVPGWVLDLVASGGGTHFQISLHNAANKCGLSVFSSDAGIIYEAGYVDCVQLAPAEPSQP